jgi:ADP-heptose:LPS heptosyltransferase
MTGATLVVRLDNAGDVLLAGPAVRAAAGAGGPVHFLCGRRGQDAARLLPGVDGVLVHRAPWIEPDPMPVAEGDARALVERVRDLGIARAAILASSHQSPLPTALLLRWAGVAEIAAVSHDHAGSLLDHRIPGDPDVHEVERGLLVTRALGLPDPDDDRLRIDLAPDGEDPPPGVELGPDLVVVHPGASVPARTLAPEQWRDAVAALARAGRRVTVTGSGEEKRLTAFVSGDHPGVLDLGGQTTLRQLARILAGAGALVTGNTGPAHLAAAVQTPVAVAFPPTVPVDRWRPWRVPHVVFGDQTVPCAGCRSRRCPLDEQVCVSRISAGEVLAAVDRLAGASTSEATPA